MTPSVVRPARRGDLDGLVRIEEAAFQCDRLDRRNFRHAIDSPTILALVVEKAGAVAGYCTVETRRRSRVAHLASVAVAPEAAGQGLGRALLQAAERAAAARGLAAMRLEVRADNGRAARLYETAGYRPIGREEDYYEDGGAACRYEKALLPG